MKLICGWCLALIKDGTEPVSHGICANCCALSEDELDLQADFFRAVVRKEKENAVR